MTLRGAITNKVVMNAIRQLVNVGEEFFVDDIAKLLGTNDVHKCVWNMSRYENPVFVHVSRGVYRLLRDHDPQEYKSHDRSRIAPPATCPTCHMQLPRTGICDDC